MFMPIMPGPGEAGGGHIGGGAPGIGGVGNPAAAGDTGDCGGKPDGPKSVFSKLSRQEINSKCLRW